MNVLQARVIRHVALRGLAVVCLAPLFCTGAARAPVRSPQPALPASGMMTRVFAVRLRPRHIPVRERRTDLRGDTPPSAKYFSITNVTALVHGFGGAATAVNDDGRIVYNDSGDGERVPPAAYVVNNGGGIDRLPDPDRKCVRSYSAAYALNENAETVGTWGCSDRSFVFKGYSAWSLAGATASTNTYFDQRYDDRTDGSYAAAENDADVAVGCDGPCGQAESSGSAAIFEPSKTSHGHITELRGLKGKTCYSSATAINDAGEIVGFSCGKAVRFYTTGYAEPLFLNSGASAEAINVRGDVVGYYGTGAFIHRGGKTALIPFPAGYQKSYYAPVAYGINASDEVVGSLYGAPDGPMAFVWMRGRSYDLNTLIAPHSGWQIADAFGVNDRGEIVGDGYYNGTLCGIALKPPQ